MTLQSELCKDFRAIARSRLVRFQVVSAQQIYNDLAVPVNGPIPNDAMSTLCQKANVKGALVLHRFTNTDNLDVDKRTETRTIDGRQQTVDIYTATYRADLQADWRFRGCNGQTYDSFMSRNGATWSGEGDTPGDAKSNVGDTDKLALGLADELGNAYFDECLHLKRLSIVRCIAVLWQKGATFPQKLLI